jgi:hypothetical protein
MSAFGGKADIRISGGMSALSPQEGRFFPPCNQFQHVRLWRLTNRMEAGNAKTKAERFCHRYLAVTLSGHGHSLAKASSAQRILAS